ncbi:MAG: aldehyde dehydrogenase family protein [Verrucomicrobiales bacterium]
MIPDSLDHLLGKDAPPALAAAMIPLVLGDGQIVFRAGEAADSLYFIDRGIIRIESDGAEIDSDPVLARLGEGEILGEMAMLDGGTRSATAVVEGGAELRRLDRAALTALESDHVELALGLWKALGSAAARRLRQTNARVVSSAAREKDPVVEAMVVDARAAQLVLADASEDAVNALLESLAAVFAREAESLAELAVQATGMGNVPDKTEKNLFASQAVMADMAGQAGAGLLGPSGRGLTALAAPAGVVFGLIPVTNPAATAIFKSLICLKSRNALILSFARRATPVADRIAGMLGEILEAGGWPKTLVQVVARENSRRRTQAFFQHPGVDLILATGGPSMVRAAHSSGRPAIGVGAGNAPCVILADAEPGPTAAMIVLSKAFDNGLICGAEHHLVAESAIVPALSEALERAGAAVLDDEEGERFRKTILNADQSSLRLRYPGKAATALAAAAGIKRGHPIKLLVIPARAGEESASHAFGRETMAPVLSLFQVPDEDSAMALARRLLDNDGTGHTAAIHTRSESAIARFAELMPASRILVNSPATQGVIGLTTGLPPSLTLGCGFYGGNITNENVTFRHVRNTKLIARGLVEFSS